MQRDSTNWTACMVCCCSLHESDVGFVVVVDRRQDRWTSVKTLLLRISVSRLRIVQYKLEMWANAQRDGRPAEYRWRPLFNAANFG